jgi:hypothetical protein
MLALLIRRTPVRILRLFLASVAALLVGSASQAVTITSSDVGDSFVIVYDGQSDGSTIAGLTASATFTVTGFTSNSLTLEVELTNTSSGPITDSRISVFGFDTDPTLASADASGFFVGTVLNGALPSGFGSIDLCVKNGQTNNCQGGGGTGIGIGATETTTVTLGFSGPIDSITLSNFGVRYQSIVGAGATTSAVGRGTPPVPEPSSIALFALGAGIVGASLHRRGRR